MKIFYLLALLVSSGLVLSAQNQGAVTEINRQMTSFFDQHLSENIFVATDKVSYKPGETIWFRAFVTDGGLKLVQKGNNELVVKLYDSKGKSEIQQIFRLTNGAARCDITLPKELAKGNYFLCVHTSASRHPEDISINMLRIDPGINNQWIMETKLKDSVSVSGQKNEFNAVARDLAGEFQKSSWVRYQLVNGTAILNKGKVKTNDKGQLTIPFTLPSKTNGEPFVMELSANRDESLSEHFLPSSLDPLQIRFYPEGGTFIPGILTKIAFTAFNKWGIPVDVAGEIKNQNGETVTQVRTIDRGLGMFTLLTTENQKFKLVITGTTGQNQTFQLPDSNPEGLSLSVVKIDAQFISANLVFADKQKHSIALTMTQGSNLSWAADLDINQSGRIKIPADSIPHGINLLSAFSSTGDLLAERIIFVDKKHELRLEIVPEKNSLATGESMKIKVRLTDEKNQPVAGNMSIAVSDQYRTEAIKPTINESLLLNSELENPFSLVSAALKGKITQSILLDVYLIANKIKNFNWTTIKTFNPAVSVQEKSSLKAVPDKNTDTQLSNFIAGYAQKYRLISKSTVADPGYYANNEGIFQKAPKVNNQNSIALENQRRMFESATSILEVIKTLKPYKIQNNMIVFVGSENSLNYQGGALIVLDGQMLGTDIAQLAGINPSEVDHINVSTNAMDIQRYTGLNSVGLIEIFQKKATSKDASPGSESNERYEQGYRVPNNFQALSTKPKKDTRTTLIWIPEQTVDATGQFEFTVTAGAVYSDFVVEVQGISENGRVGCGKAVFKVIK